MKVLIPRCGLCSRGATVLRLVTKPGTGDCTDLSLKGIAIKARSSGIRGSRSLPVGPANRTIGQRCRRTNTRRFFSMPRNLVLQAWRDRFGSVHPCVLRRKDGTVVLSDVEKEMATAACSFDRAQDAEVLEQFARPFAREFLVSPAAMRIRLETLRLVHREVSSQWSLLLGS